MKLIKGNSSHRFFKEYPSNRTENRKLWGRSYRAYPIYDNQSLKAVNNYIENQEINDVDKRLL